MAANPTDRVNVLLTTFPGLSLPRTVSFSLPFTSTTTDLLSDVSALLPLSLSSRLTLETSSNHKIYPSQEQPLSALVKPSAANSNHASLLPLTLICPLPGGKGGFGSQLRAAGGRMSSRKRKNALASDPNNGIGSNRNLDGRRLRTVTEAKNLAEYLATRPELDRREKEEKRKRWEAIVEGAEAREAAARKGGSGRGKGLSEEWLIEREDAGERAREAVTRAMAGGEGWKDSIVGFGGRDGSAGTSRSGTSTERSEKDKEHSDSSEDDDEKDTELRDEEMQILEKEAAAGDVDAIWVLKQQPRKSPSQAKPAPKPQVKFAGFDEDDEFMSSSTDEEDKAVKPRGKGKQKVVSLVAP